MSSSTVWHEVLAKRQRMDEAHAEAKTWIEQVVVDHKKDTSLLEQLRVERTMLLSGNPADRRMPTYKVDGRVEANKARSKATSLALELKVDDLEKKYTARREEITRFQCKYMNRKCVEERSELYLSVHRNLIDELCHLDEKILELDVKEAREKGQVDRSGAYAASTVGVLGVSREERQKNKGRGNVL